MCRDTKAALCRNTRFIMLTDKNIHRTWCSFFFPKLDFLYCQKYGRSFETVTESKASKAQKKASAAFYVNDFLRTMQSLFWTIQSTLLFVCLYMDYHEKQQTIQLLELLKEDFNQRSLAREIVPVLPGALLLSLESPVMSEQLYP